MDSFGIRKYYVFKYVVDKVSGEPTEYEGEVQAFVEADNPWDAVEKAGFEDINAYGANLIDNIEMFEKAIAEERKLLNKLSKELKVWKDEQQAEREKFLKERNCPNGCGQMDKAFRCDKCGFGHESKELLEEINNTIKSEKKQGNDTSQLEELRDAVQADIDAQDKRAKEEDL